MKQHQLFAIGPFCLALAAHAAELPDCGLSTAPSWGGARILERMRPSADAGAMLDISGNLRNGTPLSFSRDDAVLVADVSLSATRTTLIPSAELRLKSSWPLSFGFRFAAQRPIAVAGEVKSDDGRKLLVARGIDGQVLFIDEQGTFCNKALNARSQPPVWAMGTLSQEPDDVSIQAAVVEERKKEGSVRIIFNGVGAGQLSFQEVWVNGSTVVSSQTRNFDQFAKAIKVGPFDFEVLDVANGKVTLRFDIAQRSPANMAELARLPLRPVR